MSSTTSDRPLLSSSFRLADRSLLFSKMRLHADRVTLFGVGWTGLYRRTVPLGDVAKVMWWAGAADHEVNLAFLLHSGERLGLRAKKAGLWKYEVEARAPRLHPSQRGAQPPAFAEKKEAA